MVAQLESLDKLSPQEAFPKQLQRFISYYQNVVVPKMDGKYPWFSSFACDPKTTISGFYSVLNAIRTTMRKKPTFLDCGSADGMMAGLAAIAGFNSYGIEFNPQLFTASQVFLKDLTRQGIIPSGSIKIVQGSYYTSEKRDKIKSVFAQRFQTEGLLETDSFDDFVEEVTSVGNPITETEIAPYKAMGIGKDSTLIDLVYCYSSDLLFPFLFFEQMDEVLADGGMIAIFSPDSEDVANTGSFIKQQQFLIGAKRFVVYSRK